VKTEEQLLEEGDALELVVGEEAGDLVPHVTCGVATANNSVEDVGGDGLEEPADDGGIDGALVGVVWHGKEVDSAVNVVEEIILMNEKIEVRLPGEEVGRGVGELDRHILEDGDITDDGNGGASEGLELPDHDELKGLEKPEWEESAMVGGSGASLRERRRLG
jgi:hypothetical protein